MFARRQVRGWLVLGLSITALAFVLLPVTAGKAAPGLDPARLDLMQADAPANTAGPAIALDRPEPGPEHATFVIQYEGERVPPELRRALDNLQRAGRLSAIDAHSAPGRVFVLGEEAALLALRDMPGVIALDRAGPADEPARGQTRPPAPELTKYYLSLDPNLPAPARDRLLAYLKSLQATGRVSGLIDQGLSMQLTAPVETRERLERLPGVVFVSEALAGEDAGIQAVTANGFITGTVTSDSNGAPIPATGVCAYQPSPYVYQCAPGGTGATGVYSISVPPGSNYRVQFFPPDHHIPEYYNDVPFHNPSGYTPVSVSDSAVTANVNASLAAGAQIIGRVTDQATASPLDTIYANVESRSSGYYYAYAYSTATGVYTTVPGLPAGSYRLQFQDFGGMYATEYYTNAYRPDLATLLTVTSTNRTGIDAALGLSAYITGTVTGAGPLDNIYIYAYYGDEYIYFGSAATNASGTYRLTGLGPIPYKLQFSDFSGQYLSEWHNDKPDWDTANPIVPAPGLTTTINAQLALAGAISGTVTAQVGGAPLNNISAQAYDATSGDYVNGANTDSSGVYRIRGLAGGNYKVWFRDNSGVYLSEWHNDKPDQSSADPVSVTPGLTTTINAQLAQAGAISGTVTAEGSGVLLANVNVRAYAATSGSQAGSATTNVSGTYRIGGLDPGSYKLRFVDNTGSYLTEYYNDRPDLASADPVAVSSGVTTTVDAALASGARVVGRITDAISGSGIGGVSVTASRMDASGSGSAATDVNGYYTTTALTSGVYRVYFSPPPPYFAEYYDNQTPSGAFTPVTITAPLSRTINAALRAGLLISGTVTGPGPLEDVFVSVYRGTDTYYSSYAYSGSDGTYRVGPLNPGWYRVFFQPGDVHVGEWYNDSTSYVSSTVLNLTGHATNINANLASGGRISGTVTGAGGAPLADVEVYVYPVGSSSYIAYGATNVNGRYATQPGLTTGAYQVFFGAPPGYSDEWYNDKSSQAGANVVSVTAGVTTTINAQLSVAGASGAITGTLTAGDTGLPLPMWVYAYDAQGSYVAAAYASTGAYLLSGLPPDGYRVFFGASSPYVPVYYNNKPDFSSADPVTVTANVTRTNINQVFPRGGAITGTVTASGGAPGVYVYARRVSGGSFTRITYTGLDGSYRLEGLGAGGYKVQFTPPSPFRIEWYNDANAESSALTVTVALSATTPNINAALAAGGIITGVVTAADTGAPLPGAYAYLYSVTGTYVTNVPVDMDGRYRTLGLLPGSYKVFYERGTWVNYVPEWYNNAPGLGTAVTITVPGPGTIANINGVLARGGSISGRVYDASTGQLLDDAYIYAYHATTGDYVDYSYANSYGVYQVTGLPAGPYKLYAWRDGYREQWYNNKPDFTSALTVTVSAPGDTPNIHFFMRGNYFVYLPVILR